MKEKVPVHVITYERLARKADLEDKLKSYPSVAYGHCGGMFRDEWEGGFIITGLTDADALWLAGLMKQKCVLAVDGQRMARLLYVNGKVVELGVLVGTNTEPMEGDYTYSPVTDSYYYTRGTPRVVTPATSEDLAA